MRSITECQVALKSAGYDIGPDGADGDFGEYTQSAVMKYQRAKRLLVTAQLDVATRLSLFPEDRPAPRTWSNIVNANITDYVLNLATSKIAWAAAALVALGVSWVQTRWGLNVPPDIQSWVTTGLISLGGGVILILRGWFNNPKVIKGVVQPK